MLTNEEAMAEAERARLALQSPGLYGLIAQRLHARRMANAATQPGERDLWHLIAQDITDYLGDTPEAEQPGLFHHTDEPARAPPGTA